MWQPFVHRTRLRLTFNRFQRGSCANHRRLEFPSGSLTSRLHRTRWSTTQASPKEHKKYPQQNDQLTKHMTTKRPWAKMAVILRRRPRRVSNHKRTIFGEVDDRISCKRKRRVSNKKREPQTDNLDFCLLSLSSHKLHLVRLQPSFYILRTLLLSVSLHSSAILHSSSLRFLPLKPCHQCDRSDNVLH